MTKWATHRHKGSLRNNSIRSASSLLLLYLLIRVSSARLFFSLLSTWRFNLDSPDPPSKSPPPAPLLVPFSSSTLLYIYLWITSPTEASVDVQTHSASPPISERWFVIRLSPLWLLLMRPTAATDEQQQQQQEEASRIFAIVNCAHVLLSSPQYRFAMLRRDSHT